VTAIADELGAVRGAVRLRPADCEINNVGLMPWRHGHPTGLRRIGLPVQELKSRCIWTLVEFRWDWASDAGVEIWLK